MVNDLERVLLSRLSKVWLGQDSSQSPQEKTVAVVPCGFLIWKKSQQLVFSEGRNSWKRCLQGLGSACVLKPGLSSRQSSAVEWPAGAQYGWYVSRAAGPAGT